MCSDRANNFENRTTEEYRAWMLEEYVKGLQKPQSCDSNQSSASSSDLGIPGGLRKGEFFEAPDQTEFEVVKNQRGKAYLKCTVCNSILPSSELKYHIRSPKHLKNLYT